MRREVLPLVSRLENYSDIHVEPKVLLLRNPDVDSEHYRAWQKDHRFGRLTCPTPDHPSWAQCGAIDEAVLLAEAPHFVCVSAMVISYSNPGEYVGYHKDPAAYERIVSFTLEGSGVMNVKRGNSKGVAYDLVPDVGIVLEEEDCLRAKHSIRSSRRLGLVLRYVDVTWKTQTP